MNTCCADGAVIEKAHRAQLVGQAHPQLRMRRRDVLHTRGFVVYLRASIARRTSSLATPAGAEKIFLSALERNFRLEQHLSQLERLRDQYDVKGPGKKVCRGRIFSPRDYAIDVEQWGFSEAFGNLEEQYGE